MVMRIFRTNCCLTTAIVITLVLQFVEGAVIDFTERPVSLNATINSTRIFQCRAENSASYFWRINGTLIDPAASPEGIEVIPVVGGSSLSVYCDETRNNSRVMCVVTLENLTAIASDNATLLIQGRLEKVTNLRIRSSNSTSITLTWAPPFSLDITGVDTDFTHTIVVSKRDSGRNTIFESIVEPTFTFSPMDSDHSFLFEFSVTTVNELRLEGEPSEPVQGHFLGPVRDINFFSNQTSITVNWDPPNTIISNYTYFVELYNFDINQTITTLNTTGTEFIFTTEEPNPDDTYKILIIPHSVYNTGEASSVMAYLLGEPVSIPGEDIELLLTTDPLSLSFKFKEHVVNAIPGRRPTSYTVLAISNDSLCQCNVSTTTMNGVVTLMVGDCDGCLRQGEAYNVIIQTVNGVGVTNSTGSITIAITRTEASSVALTIASATMGGAIVVITLVSFAIIMRLLLTQKSTVPVTDEIQMEKCEAYDVVKKQTQPKRKPPPQAAIPTAYEEVDL